MIEWLKNYVLSITGVSVLILIAECFVPEGNVKKYASFALGIILSVCIISPIFSFKMDKIEIPEHSEQVFDFTSAIESTVKSVKGFEDASVSVFQNKNKIEKIVIFPKGDKLLEEAVRAVTVEALKNTLSSVYSVDKENIIISEKE